MGLANTSSAPPREALGRPPQKRGGRRVQKARRGNVVVELQDQVAHLERDRALREEPREDIDVEPREEPGDDIDVWLERPGAGTTSGGGPSPFPAVVLAPGRFSQVVCRSAHVVA